MASLLQYKCPACGGALEFNSDLQKCQCPYCNTEFATEDLKAYDECLQSSTEDELHWDADTSAEWQEDEGAENLHIYVCQSCGGEVVGDESMSATRCPYCGNPVIVVGNLSGALKPDFILPFKFDKDDAKEALKKHFTGKRLLPKVFATEAHLDEIKGLYVPFWLYDTESDATARYRATRVRTWSDRDFIYTDTRYYAVLRAGRMGFERIPVDGSSKLDNTLTESVEPFRFADLVPFSSVYLTGFLADKYDVSGEDCEKRANERVRESAGDSLLQTVRGYSGVTTEHLSVQLKNGRRSYALLPIWLLQTTWKEQNYLFAMNGQTGKLVGDLPCDRKALFKWLLGLGFGIAAIVFALQLLFFYL